MDLSVCHASTISINIDFSKLLALHIIMPLLPSD